MLSCAASHGFDAVVVVFIAAATATFHDVPFADARTVSGGRALAGVASEIKGTTRPFRIGPKPQDLTPFAWSPFAWSCIAAGMDDYTAKPLTPSGIKTVLDNFLRQPGGEQPGIVA